jgi:hypothetical protein
LILVEPTSFKAISLVPIWVIDLQQMFRYFVVQAEILGVTTQALESE